ncbi:MAG: InlB B-repeat-containing protein [Erysipelotrichales bacterium]|nr:InlB B-repeat-containing protein [Erysipelotrichales bacterium]
MDKIKELRMTLIILLIGVFFVSGCFFNSKHTVSFKTNGGTEIENISVKSGSKLSDVKIPTKEGYDFVGWYVDGEEFDMNSKIDADITLVAKWVKSTEEDEVPEETEDKTTTTTTKATKTTTASDKTTVKTTKTTKKTSITKNTTKTATTTTSSTTTTKTTTKVLEPSVDVPDIKPEEPTEKVIDIKLEVIKLSEEITSEEMEESLKQEKETEATSTKDEEEPEKVIEFREVRYLRISRTTDGANVESNIDEIDLNALLASDIKDWTITSNYGVTYKPILRDETILLEEEKNVTSLTVEYNGFSYIFEYDSEKDTWYIKYPTVSVGSENGLDLIYYNNLETAINVVRYGQVIKILEDQEIKKTLNIKFPITIDGEKNQAGERYKITNTEGYLFNLENIKYNEEDEVVIKNIDFDVDSFIYLGESEFTNVKLSNISLKIKNNKTDKEDIEDIFKDIDVLSML